MVEKDYIDITPRGVDKEGKGAAGIKSTVFQETEWEQIKNNPDRLTKEGLQRKVSLWQRSSNKHVMMKYQTMLRSCKELAPSGVTTDGLAIFSRDEKGNPKWVDDIPTAKVERVVKSEKKGE